MTVETKSLEAKIASWLDTQGYPLEMRVSQAFESQGHGCTLSTYYVDSETRQPREIDVISRFYGFQEPKDYVAIAELELFCSMECKSTKHPWVIFQQSHPNPWSMEVAICDQWGQKIMPKIGKHKSALEGIASNAGHGITQAFSSGADVTYGALTSAYKSADWRVMQAIENEPHSAEVGSHLATVVLPVVVTTSPLFSCTLAESGSTSIVPVEYGAVNFHYPRQRPRHARSSCVYVLRESAIPQFIAVVNEFSGLLINQLQNILPPKN